ncbi:Protein kinase domain [Dillenia turbinata]|uniref:Protein kinase domain n=1 Tax=Dillenia turbinata TaxID=194707 RepID=A0AAN8UN75_9MAGN
MGCMCSKGISTHEYIGGPPRREKKSKKASKRLAGSSKTEDVVAETDGVGNEITTRLISDPAVEENVESKTPTLWGEVEKDAAVVDRQSLRLQHQRYAVSEVGTSGRNQQLSRSTSITSMCNGTAGEQNAAGWPSWLTSVAGEAIRGWVPRRADSFEKLEKIGQGTYSSVYRARDLETGKFVALKKVRFINMDPESVRFMAREIHVLRRLDHPNIMKLECLVTSRVSGNLYLVFEYMQHDLAGLAAAPGIKFSESQIKCFMQQLLCGLEHCHSRGVLHRDIKGSNLLIDNNGNLKIGDFGLATFYNPSQKQPLTSRVVTLWYRPPELLLGASDYGVSVDLWSAGCILAELFAGKPIMPGRTEVEQLHKIFKLCGSPSEEYWKKSKLPHATIFKPQQPYKRVIAETFKDFPPSALSLLDVLLAVEPERRGTASSALQHEFFTTKPLPCDPSSLPKYPSSKEYDAKRRDEERRRQRAAGGGKGHGPESLKRDTKESKAVPAPDANAELAASIQKRRTLLNPISQSEEFNPEQDGASGFPIEPPGGALQNGVSEPGQCQSSQNIDRDKDEALIVPEGARNAPEIKAQMSYVAAQLSRFSGSVAVRGTSQFDLTRDGSSRSQWPEDSSSTRFNQMNGAKISGKHEWLHHLLDGPKSSHRKESGKDSSAAAYASNKNWIHYSGPLLPTGGNIDNMLKDHERQIQNAVRKTRLEKTKTLKNHTENGLKESLLH